jgi:hypothetical protein
MSRFDSLLIKALARFGVDPAAGDLAADVPPALPGSPYACTPTQWGEVSDLSDLSDLSDSSDDTIAARPKATRAAAVSQRPRRRAITVRREPVPRGLLVP